MAGQNAEFARRLAALIAASDPDGPGPRPPAIQMGPAVRSHAEQVRLAGEAQRKYGANWRKWAAAPGTSRHGDYGDGSFANDLRGDLKLAARLAPQFGLNFPMAHEPWHVELARGTAGARAQPSAPAAPAPEPVPEWATGHADVRFGIDGRPVEAAVDPVGAGGADPDMTGGLAGLPDAPVVPRPSVSLAEDPAYLAFLRALGVEDAEDAADTQARTDALGRQLSMRLPEVAEAGEDSRSAISGSFESRGLFASGGREVALARQRADEGRTVAGLESTVADQSAQYARELARRRAERARRTAEAGLLAGANLYGEQ